MTSSSSLYGTVTTQNTSSGNSTGLYGEAGTPIPDSSGNVVVRGDLYVLSGNILTTAQTGNIFPTNATTINLGNAATTVNIGAGTGTTTVNNNLTVGGDLTVDGTFIAPSADFGNIQIAVVDNQTISTTAGELRLRSTSNAIKLPSVTSMYTDNTGSFGLLNQPTTVNAFLAATSLNLGATTGTTNVNNNLLVEGTGTFTSDITAPGADLGNITIGIADNQTITTTAGELRLSSFSNAIKLPSVTSIYTDNTGSFGFLNQPTTVGAFLAATSLNLGAVTGTTNINNDLLIDGNSVGLAPATTISYSENNNRLNRPQVQSTTGNTSGWRVAAPNATTSAVANISAFNSNDGDNGKFINISARGATTSDLRIQTGKYTAGVLGASGSVVSFVDNVTTYATVNPAGPTTPSDLTTKAYVDAIVIDNTTYTINASSTTGGANFNLVGTDATTDTIKFSGSGATTVTQTSANEINISTTVTDPTKLVNGVYEFTLNADGTVTTPSKISAAGPLTLQGGALDPTTVVVDDTSLVATFDQTLPGGDSAVLTATNGSMTWAHTAGAMVMGSEDGTWSLNSDGTTSFPNYRFPYADGTSDQVLKTNGSGVLAWYSPSDLNTTYTVDATSTTGGANLNLVGSDASTDSVAYLGSGATTVTRTDANTITISSTDNNTTYDFAATATTGGANLNLTGSDSTTDTVKLTNGGHITATYTSATEVTLGSDATDANTAGAIVARDGSGNFAASGATLGAVTVGVDSDQTVSTTSGNLVLQTAAGVNSGTITVAAGANGDITLSPNGTGDVISGVTTMLDASRVYGQAIITRNTTYSPPTSALTTVTGSNGIVVASSTGGANGYGAAIAIRAHTGDTTALGNTSASLAMSGATGTSASPAGVTTNLVMGTLNFDGYTAGTSNNYASQIATANQGGGTAAISPLQVQAYARQNFTNSTTVTTAVTGASGTGTTATLTFATQNTGPYFTGQTVTVSGMTPSGYNGTYVLTAVSTSSISYANTTTGFTSGGTIAAANTVTAAGMGFRVRGYANSTNLTVPNRFNFIDLTASAATFKSNAYTFANEVITGSTLTATNYMTLGATTGSINQDTFTLKNTAGTTTYATANSTSVTLNGDTVNLRNTAGTTIYGNFTSTGTTITGAGLSTVTRTTATETPGTAMSRPSMNIQLTRSDQAAPNDSDSTSFRTRVAGSNGTFYTISDIGSVYKTGGDNEFRVNLANGDQTTGSFSGLSILSGKISETRIKAGTPSGTPGASTVSDVAIFTPTNNTLRADALTLTDYAGVALVGNNISYNRVYGQWQYDTTVTPAGSNTAYAYPIANGVIDFANIASTASTSRIIPGAAGMYKLQFSIQVQNDDNAAEHIAYFWWRKNGTDVPGSMGTVGVPKSTGAGNALTIAGWDNMISSANTTDYWEFMYAVDDATHVDFPAFGTTAFGPATASLFITLVPVGA